MKVNITNDRILKAIDIQGRNDTINIYFFMSLILWITSLIIFLLGNLMGDNGMKICFFIQLIFIILGVLMIVRVVKLEKVNSQKINIYNYQYPLDVWGGDRKEKNNIVCPYYYKSIELPAPPKPRRKR